MMETPTGHGRVRRYELLALFAILAVALFLRQYYYAGLVSADDMRHAYHGYFLFSAPDEKYAHVQEPDRTIFYRMGVNLPVWLSSHAFGPTLWALTLPSMVSSLGTVAVLFFLLRSLGGALPALLGATLAACIPIDIYIAGTVLQDCMFAFLLTLALACTIWSEQARGWARMVLLLAAGFALGYQQYVKEHAAYVLGLFGLWALFKCVEQRRILWRFLLIPAGFLIVQALFGWLFWTLRGDFFFYLEHMRTLTMFSVPPAFGVAEILDISATLVLEKWQLGYWLAAFPILAVLAWRHPGFRGRVLVLILLLGLIYAYYMPSRWTPTSRYLIQLIVPYTIMLALGLHWLLLRLPQRMRPWAGAVTIIAAGLIMAWPLDFRYHEYGPHRGAGHRLAYNYLTANGDPDDPVYVDMGHSFYTQRALYQLAGFEPPLGGFRPLEQAYVEDHGWVVLSSKEAYRRRGQPYRSPQNWLQVHRHETDLDGRLRWTAVYRVLPPQPEHDTLQIFPATGFVSLDSFRNPTVPEAMNFHQLALAGHAERYAWSTSQADAKVEPAPADAVAYRVRVGQKPRSLQFGGLVLPIRAPEAVRTTLSFADPENIVRVRLVLLDKNNDLFGEWCWFVNDGRLPPAKTATLTFVPGEPTGLFQPLGEFEPRKATHLGLWICVKPGKQATIRLHDLRIGRTPTEQSPAATDLSWRAVRLRPPLDPFRNPEDEPCLTLDSLNPEGIACVVSVPDGKAHAVTGGVRIPTDDARGFRATLEFENLPAIEAVYLVGTSTAGTSRFGWLWKPKALEAPTKFEQPLTFIQGSNTASFRFYRKRADEEMSELRATIRVKPGETATMRLRGLELGVAEADE